MLGDSEGCFSYPCKECGLPITEDPRNFGFGHAQHITKYHMKPRNFNFMTNDGPVQTVSGWQRKPSQGMFFDVFEVAPEPRERSSTPRTPFLINQRIELQILPSTSLSSRSAKLNYKTAKDLSKKIASIGNKLKIFDKTTFSVNKTRKLNAQSSFNNEASKLLYNISQSNALVNENKHMFECSVIPQFKCKLCDECIVYDHDSQKLINNFEEHLTTHFSNPNKISPTLLTDLLHCLPSPFRNANCLRISPKGLLKCTICNCNLPVTAKSTCEHLTSNAHNFLPNPAIKVPKKSQFVKICFQLDKENGICLTCFSSVNISEINNHKHPSLNEFDVTKILPYGLEGFGCFYMNHRNLVCNVCDCEMAIYPYLLYEHVLGPNHNQKLHHYLSASNRLAYRYTEAKNSLIATSKDQAFCLICNLKLEDSDIEFHLDDSTHRSRVRLTRLSRTLDKVPRKYRDNSCFFLSESQVICQLCKQEMPLTLFHLLHHLLTPVHSNNVLKHKLDTLYCGPKQVKCLAQFYPNEVICLICKEKLQPTEVMLHEHILGNNLKEMSYQEHSDAVIDCFANTLKNVKCLVQTNNNKAFCSICDSYVPFSIGNLLVHILGENHNKKIFEQFGIPKLDNFILCDNNELLCLDCNTRFPLNLKDILHHKGQSHSPTPDILRKLKKITCLTPGAHNSLLCSVCNCLVPTSVRNVLEHLLGKHHNKRITHHPKNLKCLVQVSRDEVVCLNCNCSMSGSPLILWDHILDHHNPGVSPDFSNIISQQLRNNKCLIKTVDGKVACLICQCVVPGELKNVQTHLSETNHLTNVKCKALDFSSIGKPSSNSLNTNSTDKTIDCCLDVLKQTRCLILTNDNIAICSICSCNVPLTISNLLEHVLGKDHNKNIPPEIRMDPVIQSQLQSCILCDKNCLLCLDCNAKFPINSDAILSHTRKSHAPPSNIEYNFKDVSCFLPFGVNSRLCSVCNCLVPWSVRNILEHILGRNHNNKIMNESRTSKTTNHLVQIGQEEVLCLSCNSAMLASSTILETHLSEHHNNNASPNFPRIISQQFQSNKYLIKTVDNQVSCLLCQCTFPSDMRSVQSHLSETSHTDKLSFDTSTFLTGEFANVKCFLKTDVAQAMCLICNCFVPLSSVNLNEHLLGKRHNNKKLEFGHNQSTQTSQCSEPWEG